MVDRQRRECVCKYIKPADFDNGFSAFSARLGTPSRVTFHFLIVGYIESLLYLLPAGRCLLYAYHTQGGPMLSVTEATGLRSCTRYWHA